MLLPLEIPDADTAYWIAQLEVLGLKPQVTSPLSPAEAEALRAAVDEVKAGRHAGPPLRTREEWEKSGGPTLPLPSE